MKILCITNIFPDVSRPGRAPYTRLQLVHLAAAHEVRVIAPVAWPHYAALLLRGERPAPTEDCRAVMSVSYPCSYYTPKILRRRYGAFYRRSIEGLYRRLVAADRPDVVYATWAYPDCWAAAQLAGRDRVPVVMRVHGSDIHQYFAYPDRKRLIVEAMSRASAVVSVSGALRDLMAEAGVEAGKIHVLYNGLDRGVFRPADRLEARREAGVDPAGAVILYAGNFERVKGVDLLIEAFGRLEASAELHIVGDGPEGNRLAGLARALPAGKRAVFHPRVDHRRLAAWLNAADVVCLPSLAEGMPNVVFEALACRPPVVAADTGGVPEAVSASSGILFRPGDAGALAAALAEALGRPWDRGRIECLAGSWADNARALGGLLERAARDRAGTSR